MIESILLVISFILYYLYSMGHLNLGAMAFFALEFFLLSICLFIMIIRFMKTKIVTPGTVINGTFTLIFMGYLIFLWVFLITFELP